MYFEKRRRLRFSDCWFSSELESRIGAPIVLCGSGAEEGGCRGCKIDEHVIGGLSGGMYNMSGLLPVPGQGDVSGTGATPRTPEILNSLMSMTNPFDAMRLGGGPRVASSPPSDTTSTSSSSTSSTSPPSVQHTCSQLIKEGLKLTIQTKRRNNPSSSLTDEPHTKGHSRKDELTPEDEERRRRRRERNKIAATKCRLKKRERTVNLVKEAEILENQNQDLKLQIQDLENQTRMVKDMLSVHSPSCAKQPHTGGVGSPSSGTSVSSYTTECYTQCTSASSSPAGYSTYQPPYCKLDGDLETFYRHKTETTASYQKLESVDELGGGGGGYGRPSPGDGSSVMLTYHNFEQQGVLVKEPSMTYCRQMESESYGVGYGDGGYPGPEAGRHYPRPATLGHLRPPNQDYEANNNVLDSPNVAPTNYRHFDEGAENFAAGFPSGSCVT